MKFDDEFTQKLERINTTPDVMEQRERALALANIQPGARALDVGPGSGITTYALGELVGETGSVIGIDNSESVLAIARRRCSGQDWVSFELADATAMLFDDASFDVAFATQTYEYVQDVEAALADLYRVLRPGARAVILNSDWDSCVWRTSDRERMHRVIDLWNTHCPHPFLPRTLKQDLERAGFDVVERAVHTIFNPDYAPNTYSYGVIDFIHSYVKGVDGVSHEEIDAWAEELHRLGEKGDYFFSLDRYIFVAEKPL